MTRGAVEEGLDQFVDDLLDAAAAEFSVSNALRGGSVGPRAGLVDRLLNREGALRRRVVEPRLERYRTAIRETFAIVLVCAEGTATVDERAQDILKADLVTGALRPDLPPARRAAVREAMLARYRRLAELLTPLIHSPADGFWDAVARELDREEALQMVDETFAFTGLVVEHRDAFVFQETLDLSEVLDGAAGMFAAGLPRVEVEFTDEAVRTMRRAEATVARRAKREIRRRYGE